MIYLPSEANEKIASEGKKVGHLQLQSRDFSPGRGTSILLIATK